MTKVSVIIPAYNVEAYLRQCVDSVLNQTFSDFEIILIDDGSTDETGKICEEYDKKYSKVHSFHQENSGLSSARNIGTRYASGEFFFFLDSDDYISPNCIELLYKCAIQENVKIVFGRHYSFLDGTMPDKLDEMCSTSEGILIQEQDYLKQLLMNGPSSDIDYVICCNKLFHKSLFSSIHFEENRLFEDEYIIHQLIHAAGVAYRVDYETYFYRIRKDSIRHSRRFTERRFNDFSEFMWERANFYKMIAPDLFLPCMTAYVDNLAIAYFSYEEKRDRRNIRKLVRSRLQKIGNELDEATYKKLFWKIQIVRISPRIYKALYWH